KEIAKFMALSGEAGKTALFALYQIPSIFPLAIPCSAFVSAAILLQTMSRSQELTSMRASGLSLTSILGPLMGASFLLSLLSFSFCATLSPYCTRKATAFFYQNTSKNPLVLLQRQNLIQIRNCYLKMNITKEGKRLEDFLLILPIHGTCRLA